MYVTSFYRFAKINKLLRAGEFVEDVCVRSGVQGTCILANEGINAAFAHPDAEVLETIVDQIREFLVIREVRPILSRAHRNTRPFDKLSVRIRPEIVSYDSPFDFTLPKLPKVSSTQWNDLLQSSKAVVLDVRNQYEHDLGRFRNSMQPQTQNFREFKDFLQQQHDIDSDQTIALYCTGGIRCEKAAQSMYNMGFKSIFQLDRGILGYLKETTKDSLWEGECFVFDQRVALDEDLMEGSAELCLACGEPLSLNDKAHPHFEYGISCSTCYQDLTNETHARRIERLRQLDLARRHESTMARDVASESSPH